MTFDSETGEGAIQWAALKDKAGDKDAEAGELSQKMEKTTTWQRSM